MRVRALPVALLVGLVLGVAAAPADAGGRWDRGHRGHYHGGYYGPQVYLSLPPAYYVPPPPVYYAPPPPPPVYYAPPPPPPVYYGPPQLNFVFPLRF
jgi:hypothetical protein